MRAKYADVATTMKALGEIRQCVGQDGVSVDKDDLEEHGYSEWSTSNTDVRPVAIVRPKTTEDVSEIAKICTKYKVPIVPYGAGSSVEGNFSSPYSGICLDMSSMDKIVAFHPEDMDVVVQPGVNWVNLNDKIEETGLFLPLDPSPTALVGGMVATNCSGTNAMRYGTMKDYVVNLTVVLADGSVIKTRYRPRKTSAGYNLTALFTGSEGTLGIITEVTLKLAIIPESFSVATATFSSVKEAADAAFKMMRRGVPLAALELMDEVQMQVINKSGGDGGRMWDELPTLFLKCSRFGQLESKLSGPTSQLDLRALRYGRQMLLCHSHEWQNLSANKSKETANDLGLFASVLGHVGDGNFHQVVMYKPDQEKERKAVEGCINLMMDRALEMEGTVSGEHGIGLGKKHCLEKELGPATIGVMKALKETLDPQMRVSDLVEWRVVQVVHPQLLAAVTLSLAGLATDHPSSNLRRVLQSLQSELKTLALVIPICKELSESGSSLFKVQVKEVVSSLNKLFAVDLFDFLRDISEEHESDDCLKLWSGDFKGLNAIPLVDQEPCESVTSAVRTFNKSMEAYFQMRLEEPTPHLEEPGTKVQKSKNSLQMEIELLLSTLQNQLAECESGVQHQIVLQLAGRKWESSESTAISLFVSGCGNSDTWQEVHYSAPSIYLLDPSDNGLVPYMRCSQVEPQSPEKLLGSSIFLNFGKLLVEIETGSRVVVAEKDNHDNPSLWLTIEKFVREKMPSATESYLQAIEGCLDLHTKASLETAEELTRLTYKSIISHLEKDQSHYRRPSLKRQRDQPDQRYCREEVTANSQARKKWTDRGSNALHHRHNPIMGKSVTFEDVEPSCDQHISDGGATKRARTHTLVPSGLSSEDDIPQTRTSTATADQMSNQTKTVLSNSDCAMTSKIKRSTEKQLQMTSPRERGKGFEIFDDVPEHVHDVRTVAKSKWFYDNINLFLSSYLPDTSSYPQAVSGSKTPSRRVRICVIDTGIDLMHPGVRGGMAGQRLKELKSWKNGPTDMTDNYGHGTHVADIIFRTAPEAEIYVAKIADAKYLPEEDELLIAHAIDWAVAQDVDIISISLGMHRRNHDVDGAVNRAIAAGKILIAAAGNHGNNGPRAFPGSNRHVICIHASDGAGKDGKISPQPSANDDNFMTLGIAVPLTWKQHEIFMSGTSFATAIASAIAADVLEIAKGIAMSPQQHARLNSAEGMRVMFQLLSPTSDGGYRYVAPWGLWNHRRTDGVIRDMILEKLDE
ncbi:hypothetical protein AK830_g4744 [Neonectria ditissima]|uniref:FAD-binding PCMH-type domain-containing protein n=1 Tax=Neonectria ditissima TaxID=78410 RepID=A0A0P7BKN3_9HYPO|nr:hypothetical protein AK830_g4744 [Neonectria ditissima]